MANTPLDPILACNLAWIVPASVLGAGWHGKTDESELSEACDLGSRFCAAGRAFQSLQQSDPGSAGIRDQLLGLPERGRVRLRRGSDAGGQSHSRHHARQRGAVHELCAVRSRPRRAPEDERREVHRAPVRRGRAVDPVRHPQLVPDAAADRGVGVLHAPDAVRLADAPWASARAARSCSPSGRAA